MGRAPKVLPAETAPVEATEASQEPAGSADATTDVPQGNPLEWTFEQVLAAANFPLDKVKADLAAQAERSGLAGIAPAYVLSVLQNHANPAVVGRMLVLAGEGLVKVITTGEGPVGHSGSDLVG